MKAHKAVDGLNVAHVERPTVDRRRSVHVDSKQRGSSSRGRIRRLGLSGCCRSPGFDTSSQRVVYGSCRTGRVAEGLFPGRRYAASSASVFFRRTDRVGIRFRNKRFGHSDLLKRCVNGFEMPGDVTGSRPVGGILSGSRFGRLRGRPSIFAAYPEVSTDGTSSSCMALLQAGFTEPSRSPGMLVRSYRTFSPLPARSPMRPVRRFVFCGTFLRVASTGSSQRLSLRSPDLPRRSELRRGRPTNSLSHQQPVCTTTKRDTRHSGPTRDRPNKPVVAHQTRTGTCCGTNKPSSGDGRDRTDDILFAEQVLYQLSYTP